MITEDRAKKIGESIGHALGWGFIALLVMNFMGYDIVHEDNYYTPEYVEELESAIAYLEEECDYYKYTGTYNGAVVVYLESIVAEYDEYLLDYSDTSEDIVQRARDCAIAESYYKENYSADYDFYDIVHSVNTDVLWAVHRNRE